MSETVTAAVNKSDTWSHFVNRLSPLQRAILREVAASDRGWLSTSQLRRVFGLPWPPGYYPKVLPTASQRASLSRSLRRLERAGYLTRPKRYGVALTDTGRAVHQALLDTEAAHA